jgi:menaquinone-specific isochorismate synthase
VTMAAHLDLVWIRRSRALIGRGSSQSFDPGTGPLRYQRALVALRESGRRIAMASFTFDPEEPGSVIEMPEDLVETAADELPALDFAPIRGRVVSDGAEAWRSGVHAAQDSIEANLVEKVVMSRQVDIEFDSEVPINAVIDRLQRTEPDCYTFHVKGLVGASPELLVSLQDGQISSVALAGTAPNTESLVSDKMNREHALSSLSVEEGIKAHTVSLDVQERTVLRFGEISHLATRFAGPALSGTTVMDVLGSLHPTAAVSGQPSDSSMKVIREVEPRSRGRYAGPVGWFNVDGEGEFAIALRCGLIASRKATLYAGGGIVLGSDVHSEFAETELKLRPMLQALGLQ